MFNIKIISLILFIILSILAYNYFTSFPVEPDNTIMNDDDSIQYTLDQYEQPTNLKYSFTSNSNPDFSFNNVVLQNMGSF